MSRVKTSKVFSRYHRSPGSHQSSRLTSSDSLPSLLERLVTLKTQQGNLLVTTNNRYRAAKAAKKQDQNIWRKFVKTLSCSILITLSSERSCSLLWGSWTWPQCRACSHELDQVLLIFSSKQKASDDFISRLRDLPGGGFTEISRFIWEKYRLPALTSNIIIN